MNKNGGKQLDKFRAKKYEILFIGADFDQFDDARDLGSFDGTKHLTLQKGDYVAAMCNVAKSASFFSASGRPMDISSKR